MRKSRAIARRRRLASESLPSQRTLSRIQLREPYRTTPPDSPPEYSPGLLVYKKFDFYVERDDLFDPGPGLPPFGFDPLPTSSTIGRMKIKGLGINPQSVEFYIPRLSIPLWSSSMFFSDGGLPEEISSHSGLFFTLVKISAWGSSEDEKTSVTITMAPPHLPPSVEGHIQRQSNVTYTAYPDGAKRAALSLTYPVAEWMQYKLDQGSASDVLAHVGFFDPHQGDIRHSLGYVSITIGLKIDSNTSLVKAMPTSNNVRKFATWKAM